MTSSEVFVRIGSPAVDVTKDEPVDDLRCHRLGWNEPAVAVERFERLDDRQRFRLLRANRRLHVRVDHTGPEGDCPERECCLLRGQSEGEQSISMPAFDTQ